MTTEEAKFILTGYRPGADEEGDPALAEALQRAAADGALGRWLTQNQALDQALRGRLLEVEPPPGLRAAILAGAQAGGARRRRVPAWGWLAVAAAVALAVFLLPGRAKLPPESAQLGRLAVTDMVTADHDSRGPAVDALVGRLQSKAPLPAADEIDFENLRETGCRRIDFEGHDLLEVCFSRNGAMFHFYVTRREGDFGKAVAKRPAYLTEAAGAVAVWSDDRFAYAVATTAGVTALRRLFR
jgi:hypothetical protein